jgi:hypothetical protein
MANTEGAFIVEVNLLLTSIGCLYQFRPQTVMDHVLHDSNNFNRFHNFKLFLQPREIDTLLFLISSRLKH